MYCSNCGSEFPNESKFCNQCGSDLQGNTKAKDQRNDSSKASNYFWGFIGLSAGHLLFSFVFYLALQEGDSIALLIGKGNLGILIVAVYIICSISGAYYFQKKNKEVKIFDNHYPELKKSFFVKFSLVMIGFFGTCIMAWLGFRFLGGYFVSGLTMREFSSLGLMGFVGATTLWEAAVLKEWDILFK